MSATDDQLRQLDQRAGTAAADLRARAAARPTPAFDPDHAVVTPLPAARSGTRGRSLAVAAVVLAVAAIAGLLVSRSGDHDDDKAKVISTDPRPFVLTEPPAGFTLTGAGEVTVENSQAAGQDPSARRPVVLFGPDVEDPQLAISVQPPLEGSATEGLEVVKLEDGREAYRYDGLGLGAHALLVPGSDRSVLFASPTLEEAELRSLAAEARVTDGLQVDFGEGHLPDGWKEVSRFPTFAELGGSVTSLIDPSAVGRYTAYLPDDTASEGSPSDDPTDPGVLTVSSTPGDAEHLYATAVLSDRTSKTTIRGHDALLSTSVLYVNDEDHPTPMRTVSWIEQPGEVVRVSGTGLTERQLLATAQSAEPLGSAEWKDLLERSQLGDFAQNDDPALQVTVAEGRFADGSRWRLEAIPSATEAYPDPSVSLSVAVADPGDSQSSSGSGSPLGGSGARGILTSTIEQTGGKTFAGALVGPDVARVELRGPDDEVLEVLEIHTSGEFRGVAARITTDTASLVTFDAAGKETGRDDLGLPIGSGSSDGGDVQPPDSAGSSSGPSETTIVSGSGSSIDSGSGSSSGPSAGG